MSDNVRSTDRVRAVKHTEEEGEAVAAVPGFVVPGGPDRARGCVGLRIDVRHDCTDDDGDQYASNHGEAADSFTFDASA